MQTKQTYAQAIDTAVTAALTLITRNESFRSVDKIMYLKEFRTASLKLPRQCGKTHYLLRQLETNLDESIIVHPKAVEEDMALWMFKDSPKYKEMRLRSFLLSDFQKAVGRDHPAKIHDVNEFEGVKLILVNQCNESYFQSLYKWAAEKADPDVIILNLYT